MNKKTLIIAFGACLIFGIALSCKKAEPKPELKPNIILVMADDQGWGDMGYNGSPIVQTPNFDKMATEGLRFDHFYAASPVCSPTRGSVMTGRHPNRFGCFKYGHTLRPQEITIAEALKEAGYVTGHFGKWHLGSVVEGSPVSPGASGFDEWLSAFNFYDNDPILSENGIAVQQKGESSMVAVDAALEFIKKHKDSEQPVFTVIWFGSPHSPLIASEAHKNKYKSLSEELQNFYGEISGMDDAIGKLRSSLRELGIADNTILWYNSDNGGSKNFASTGGRAHKGKVYEGGLRVPAIIEWPARIKSPRITNVPGNTYDIYPTLLELVNHKVPNQLALDGVSLVDVIDGKTENRTNPMGFWHPDLRGISTPSNEMMQEVMNAQKEGKPITNEMLLRSDAGEIKKSYSIDSINGHAAWIDWPWKLHWIENKGKINYELYNLDVDSMEVNDVYSENAELGQKMRVELENWQESVVNSLNGNDY